jgi:hypothetical protein
MLLSFIITSQLVSGQVVIVNSDSLESQSDDSELKDISNSLYSQNNWIMHYANLLLLVKLALNNLRIHVLQTTH